MSLDVNFNELLTNDVVSFEQLGPDSMVNSVDPDWVQFELDLHSFFLYKGDNLVTSCELFLQAFYETSSEKGSTLKGKNLIKKGADSFLKEQVLFLEWGAKTIWWGNVPWKWIHSVEIAYMP